MIESLNAKIDNIVVHQIGCKAEGGQVYLSKAPLAISADDDMTEVLKLYFFKPFKTDAYFNMTHPDGVENNMLYNHVSTIFDDPQSFYEQSILIAESLYEASNHPKIRGGELYVVHFTDCVVDGNVCDAVGIFKSESKETFLRVYLSADDNIQLDTEKGISIRRLDKGCIIFNIEREDGYRADRHRQA